MAYRSRLSPEARYSPALAAGFSRYLSWYLARHFHGVRVARGGLPHLLPDRPHVIFTNHPSWWDPAFFLFLQSHFFPRHRGFGPMDAAALARYPILERVGVFGIDLDSARGAARFFRVCTGLLADPANLVYITAQGRFTDTRVRPLRLRPGLAHLARAFPDVVMLPLAVEYCFWDESRPEALCRFGEPIEVASNGGRALGVREWTLQFELALERNLEALSAASRQREAHLFQSLLGGRSGVGGVYDVWRRLRAWSRGAHFDPAHGARRPAEPSHGEPSHGEPSHGESS
jgi:1-acyl-sn-glycerol-3-phosphate acyltransferase